MQVIDPNDPVIAYHMKTERNGWQEVYRHSFDWLGWTHSERNMIEQMLTNGDYVITIGWDMYQLIKEKSA